MQPTVVAHPTFVVPCRCRPVLHTMQHPHLLTKCTWASPEARPALLGSTLTPALPLLLPHARPCPAALFPVGHSLLLLHTPPAADLHLSAHKHLVLHPCRHCLASILPCTWMLLQICCTMQTRCKLLRQVPSLLQTCTGWGHTGPHCK